MDLKDQPWEKMTPDEIAKVLIDSGKFMSNAECRRMSHMSPKALRIWAEKVEETPEEARLSDEQVENWRNVLVSQFGPYGLVMSREKIQAYRDRLQQLADVEAAKEEAEKPKVAFRIEDWSLSGYAVSTPGSPRMMRLMGKVDGEDWIGAISAKHRSGEDGTRYSVLENGDEVEMGRPSREYYDKMKHFFTREGWVVNFD